VRAQPELWDNLITFHTGASVVESADSPATNLVADPVLVGNGLAGSGVLYIDEGSTQLNSAAAVDALPEAQDTFDGDPFYINRPADDYRLEAGRSVVLAEGAPMLYRANSSDPGIGTAWTAASYDTTGWLSGTYGVGYETSFSPPWAVDLIQTSVPANTASVYTRANFTVSDLSQVRGIELGIDWDDGVVAWINGVEVFRSAEMPGGSPEWNSHPALHEASNATDPVYTTFDISTAALPALQQGANVLAIGVWNRLEPTSSDLVLVPRIVLNPQDSPAVDAAHGTAPRRALLDFSGQTRSRDGNGDSVAMPDVGAHER
jgi:hypothetical protein